MRPWARWPAIAGGVERIYRPAAHARGDTLSVIVEADGTAWIEAEWTRRLADRQDDYARLLGGSRGRVYADLTNRDCRVGRDARMPPG